MTFNQIQVAVFRRCNYLDTPAADVVTRISQWINIWQQRILAKPGMDDIRDSLLTFASVAGQTTYALPQGITRIDDIFEATTPRSLRLGSISWIRQYDPQLLATGVPEVYAAVSGSQVMQNPVVPSGVWVASTSALDTTQIAHLDGLRTGGYRSGDQYATVNGTTRVAIGTYTDFIDLSKAFITARAAGDVSFYDAAVAGNELARISPGRTSQKQYVIQLWPKPTTTITYQVDCKRIVDDMTVPTDVPTLPAEFHWLLIEAGSYEEWTRKDDPRAQNAMVQLQDGVKDLRNWVTNLPDYKPKSGERFDRPSRLGGQYPAW